MSKSFEIAEVISAIDHFMQNRELYQTDPDLSLRFVDQLKKMEVWFLSKVYVDNARFMHKVADFCRKGPLTDVRIFMAFAKYSFRNVGPERFEDRIHNSSLTRNEQGMVIGYFRIGEIGHALVQDSSGELGCDDIYTRKINFEESGDGVCCRLSGYWT